MRSEGADGEADGSGFAALLRSQGLGLACGQATVLLLAIGSFVMAHVEGAPAPALDDLTAFFRAPSIHYAWLYLLVPVLGLYALNTVLCTWHHVVRRWRAGQRALPVYAGAVMHVAFLLALVAHAVGGLWSEEREPVMLGARFVGLGDGREARVVGLDEEQHPDGSPRQIHARLEVREGGSTRVEEVSWNGPLSRGFGADLLLLAQAGRTPAARLSVGDQACTAEAGGACLLSGVRIAVDDVLAEGPWEKTPVVSLRARDRAGTVTDFYLPVGGVRDLAGGTLRFERLEGNPAVLLRHRHAPGNPWALASAMVLLVGIAMLGRRWI